MAILLTDFDGMLLYTEFAKSLSYYITVQALRQNPDRNEAKIIADSINLHRFSDGDIEAKKIMEFAGGTREQFTQRVWNWSGLITKDIGKLTEAEKDAVNQSIDALANSEALNIHNLAVPVMSAVKNISPSDFEVYEAADLSHEVTGLLPTVKHPYNASTLDYGEIKEIYLSALRNLKCMAVLSDVRVSIKDGIIKKRSSPQQDNIIFFDTYNSISGRLVGLISQSKRGGVAGLENLAKDICRFEVYDGAIACSGDKNQSFLRDVPKDERKSACYKQVYQLLSASYGIQDGIAFEDTADGVKAAKAADLTVVGTCIKEDKDGLLRRGADLVIYGTEQQFKLGLLGYLIPTVNQIINLNAQDTLDEFQKHLETQKISYANGS